MKTLQVHPMLGGRYWLFSPEPYFDTDVLKELLGTFDTVEEAVEDAAKYPHLLLTGFNIFDTQKAMCIYAKD